MIAAVSWVPKGVAKMVPQVAEPPSKEEIEEMLQAGTLVAEDDEHEEQEDDDVDMDATKEEEDDEVALASAAAEALGKDSNDIADALRELDMDNYDQDNEDGVEVFSKGLGDSFYQSNELDPYLIDKNDDDSEEEDDMIIKAEDSVIICAHNDEDISQLEVYILEETEDGPNLYIHHDIIISAFPLCTAWLDFPLKGGERGNFIAVGSMEPAIEIWDLDTIDEVEPSLVLGGAIEKKKKKGKKKSVKYKVDSHTDSVLGLAWNKEVRNILASASADKRVKIWDLATGKCINTMDHHTDKVQAVAFSHHVPHILLSGSFDHSIVVRDLRNPSHSGLRWSVAADPESLAWDPHTEYNFIVSLENGMIQGFDIRAASSSSQSELKPSFTIHAHEKAATSVSYNSAAPNLLASGSVDKTVKLWDLSNNQPSCIASKNPKAGAVFVVSFSVDNPFLLGIGGSKGKLEVWDTLSEAGVAKKRSNVNAKNN